MSPSRQFILRPVATSLLMIAILLTGIVAYRQLPVSALPQVDYPTIQVVTFYPGASPDVAASAITAPFSGRVGLRLVDPGNIVHATDANALAVITQLQPITVIFSVAEDYLPQIQQQLRAGKTLLVDAFDRAQAKKLATGTLQTLDNQIDTTTGTLKLKAVFTNEDESLFPNQFVNARLLVDTLHDATLVPNTVVQRNAESAFVYVLKPDQTVVMQTITVATTDGNASAVEGIAPGAVVAADNFNRLTDGAKVTVRKPSNEGSVERRSVERTGRSPAERSDAPTLQRSHASTPTRP